MDFSLIDKIVEALYQCVDDMGEDGFCVCPAAKAQAIDALQRYKKEAGVPDEDMQLPTLDLEALHAGDY